MAELIFTCNQQQKRNDNNYFKFNIFLCFDLWSLSISYKCSIHTYIAWYTLEEWQLPNNQSSHFLVHKGEVDKGITTLTLLPVLRQSADPSRAITGDDCWAGQVLAAPHLWTQHWLNTDWGLVWSSAQPGILHRITTQLGSYQLSIGMDMSGFKVVVVREPL